MQPVSGFKSMKHLPLVTMSQQPPPSPRHSPLYALFCGRLDKPEINRVRTSLSRPTKRNFYRGLNRNFPLPSSLPERREKWIVASSASPDRTVCDVPLLLDPSPNDILDRERSERRSLSLVRIEGRRRRFFERKDRSLFTGEKVADARIGR